jgi:hypothetical protein
MRIGQTLLLLALPALLLAGCATSRITNLTPQQLPRNSTGLYPVEMVWESTRASIRPETVQPVVQIGLESFPMKQVNLQPKRWETLIPVPAGSDTVNYRIRVDYQYRGIPVSRADSRLSDTYRLKVTSP